MQATLDRHIEANSAIRGGKPHITGTRITVSDVVLMHLRLGQGLEQIAGTTVLSPRCMRRWRTTMTIRRRSTGAWTKRMRSFRRLVISVHRSFERESRHWARIKALKGE